ncbi:MAG: hypothetical protein V3575_01520 [Candidatus Absconditabacteria bacterium]
MVVETNAVFLERDDLILEEDSSIVTLGVNISNQLSDVMSSGIDMNFDEEREKADAKSNIEHHHLLLLGKLNSILDRYESNELFSKISIFSEKDISNHFVKLLQHFAKHFRNLSLVGVDYSIVESRLIDILKVRMLELKNKNKDYALYTIGDFIASKNILGEKYFVIFSWLVQ